VKFDFIVPRRPVSFQCKDRNNLNDWKDYVYGRALNEWKRTPILNQKFRFSVVYLCESDPPDINNIIKPIEDVLIGLVYPDDSHVLDVDGHTRFFDSGIDIVNLPEKLQRAVYEGVECVYISVTTINSKVITL
jgi:crossover junction endodeoxyribonuclease RusA